MNEFLSVEEIDQLIDFIMLLLRSSGYDVGHRERYIFYAFSATTGGDNFVARDGISLRSAFFDRLFIGISSR